MQVSRWAHAASLSSLAFVYSVTRDDDNNKEQRALGYLRGKRWDWGTV